jgi:hypothetical protein
MRSAQLRLDLGGGHAAMRADSTGAVNRRVDNRWLERHRGIQESTSGSYVTRANKLVAKRNGQLSDRYVGFLVWSWQLTG